MRACAQGKLEGVPVPPRIAQQPGHYSVVGLLPEDHTFSKGMLFLLEPGTKCVIFDVDGRPSQLLPAEHLLRYQICLEQGMRVISDKPDYIIEH